MIKLGKAYEFAVARKELKAMIDRLEKLLGAEKAFPITSKLLAAYEEMRER